MPNKNYIRGVALEREVVKIFKEKGWEAVRTAGSHSPYDVTLIKYTQGGGQSLKKICFVCFVQCKTKVLK